LARAADLLRAGEVLAIKGLGGYHLACDARNSKAVRTLRDRKGRASKPFAVMCASLDEALRVCDIDPAAEIALLSPMRPVVLLPVHDGTDISPLVAPGLREIGVMLPYTPLHQLLLTESPPTLVMTSGNLTEEPIVHRDDEAHTRLGAIAYHFLEHDRPIHVACDDSVARIDGGAPILLRRARGYVPSPIDLGRPLPAILACGGDLKSTFCLTKGTSALLSQHLGDLSNVAAIDHYRDMVEHFRAFFQVTPEITAHDLHPDYHSTHFALAAEGRKFPVQHHHAHIASCMAEHRLDGPVLGVSFDGTGFGTDGTIWGGEFLVTEYHEFRRAGHIACVPLPGGEAAIHRPSRLALSYLTATFGPSDAESLARELLPALSSEEARTVALQVKRGLNSPLTSSMGRLFDAVSALAGVCTGVRYEGQAAMELEALAGTGDRVYPYEIAGTTGDVLQIDWRPLFAALVDDLRGHVPIPVISHQFHTTIADIVVSICAELRRQTDLDRVVLSGGVFQNALLSELSLCRLASEGFTVYRHSLVPCNDGGLSLGQAVVAAEKELRGCA
jgi:hydrogenase maturation protein HypF